jgi:hypothetical protein
MADHELDRPSLIVVDPTGSEVPQPIGGDDRTRRPNRSTRAGMIIKSKSNRYQSVKNLEPANADGRTPLSLEELQEREDDKRALLRFREMLLELVAGTPNGSLIVDDPPKVTRNPFKKLRRYFEEEPRFEDLVAKYTSLLPLLEQPSGLRYCEMALIGVKALQARRVCLSRRGPTSARESQPDTLS